MNWLDLALIGSLSIGALLGAWIGVIRGAFALGGVCLAITLVANFRGDAAALIADYVPNETLTAAVGYAATIGVAAAATVIVASIVRTAVYRLFLGWVDRLGGMAAGLGAATLALAVVMVGISSLGYGQEPPRDGLVGTVLVRTPHALAAKDELVDALRGSSLAPILANVTRALPESALELAPADFKASLDDLGRQTE